MKTSPGEDSGTDPGAPEAANPPNRNRGLPQVDRLSNSLPRVVPQPMRVEAARHVIARAQQEIETGADAPEFELLVDRASEFLAGRSRRRLSRVINATGVILHTNLGRAPLGPEAIAAIDAAAPGYTNLEYDLETNSRGTRYDHAAALLAQLVGAEAALVVNNNAAAVMLALTALSKGHEAIISRGELIEIGGEFRIPEIMAASGALMREVGTTNRTHLKDYRKAVTVQTAVILKVHPSNYQIKGFAASVAAAELAAFAHERGLLLVHDLGSGLLRRQLAGTSPEWLRDEPTVTEAVADGADIVTFSGDKLLGGPQAGIIVGTDKAIGLLRQSPMLRAVRVDKTTIAALQATLMMYADGREGELPLWRMALAASDEIERRAEAIALGSKIDEGTATLTVVPGYSTAGGGSAPDSKIPTVLLRLDVPSPDTAIAELSRNDPPIIARIEAGAVVLDLRTVDPGDDKVVTAALRRLS